LYIYADGAKTEDNEADKKAVTQTREVIQNITGFKKVVQILSEKNKGLANSIIVGVTEVVNRHKKIIVLEDDLIVSPYFLKYMNDGLDIYENNEEVISIHAYNYPIKTMGLPNTFFMRGADCWGWATWARGWNLFEADTKKLLKHIEDKKLQFEFDIEGSYPYIKMLKDQIENKVDSWAIRWYASAFINNKYTLYPKVTIIYNIGFDNSGTHSGSIDNFNNKNWNNHSRVPIILYDKIENNRIALARWKKYHREANATNIQTTASLYQKLKRKCSNLSRKLISGIV
jgi:hypothetical protein